ncbi:amino acid dehydrogenase, partial [Pseudomonas sp. GW247-3R2A]
REAASFEHARHGLADPQQQHVLSRAECAQLEPALAEAPFVGAIYTPDEEVADRHAFCQQLLARLQASGRCEFLLGRKV